MDDPRVRRWLGALEARHLASLTPSEAARALRALSSCYVERRARLAAGGALDSAGKRAAFALFYAPLHFLVTREVVRAVNAAPGIFALTDLGCGTGAAGAAWALECAACDVTGADRNAWATAEAQWTYRTLGLRGRAFKADIDGMRLSAGAGRAILAAYSVNELPDPVRAALLPRLARGPPARDAHSNRRADCPTPGDVVDRLGEGLHRGWRHVPANGDLPSHSPSGNTSLAAPRDSIRASSRPDRSGSERTHGFRRSRPISFATGWAPCAHRPRAQVHLARMCR